MLLRYLWYRRCHMRPAKIVVLCFIVSSAVLILHQVAEVLFLRKLRTHPRYVTFKQNDGRISFVRTLEEKPAVLDTSTVLCVDAFTRTPYKSGKKVFPICIHPPEADIYISKSLGDGVLYEQNYVYAVLSRLKNANGMLGFLDIGANIGTYSLPVAHCGINVVAVEALPENIARLQVATSLGNLEHRITVINAVVSNKQGTFYPLRIDKNIGGTSVVPEDECYSVCDKTTPITGIYMDDLINRIKFTRGVLKMDIEGSEEKALEHASELLEKVDFFAVIMEWRMYREMRHSPSSYPKVRKLISFFTSLEYVPCDVLSSRDLHIDLWEEWPNHVMWKKPSSIVV